jgi:L-cystine uptake protein TcyP (sodium:dicarboxylate symporter family)
VLVPLVFASIIADVANLRQHHQMHPVWQVTLTIFIFTMALPHGDILAGMIVTLFLGVTRLHCQHPKDIFFLH